VGADRAGRDGGHRRGAVAVRFDRVVVRRFLRRAARGDGGGCPGAGASRGACRLGPGGGARGETRLRSLAGGATALRERPGGGECAPLRGDRRCRRGRVPEAPWGAAIISYLGLRQESAWPLRSCFRVRARSRWGCSRRSPTRTPP